MTESEILDDPSTSDWLRNALRAALACDPVRAANDAACLSSVLQQRVGRLAEIEELVVQIAPGARASAKA